RRLVAARQHLRNSHVDRAQAYSHMRKYAEAVGDWNRAIDLSPKSEQPEFRALRATARARAGQVAEAVADVAELMKLSGWNAGQLYNFACVHALASARTPDKEKEHADLAMSLLQRAVKAGFDDAARAAKDKDLDPLRKREDFANLLASLLKTKR